MSKYSFKGYIRLAEAIQPCVGINCSVEYQNVPPMQSFQQNVDITCQTKKNRYFSSVLYCNATEQETIHF